MYYINSANLYRDMNRRHMPQVQDDDQQNNRRDPPKLSQLRDYLSMKATSNHHNKKTKKRIAKNIEKHIQQAVGNQAVQQMQEEEIINNVDSVSMMSQYNSQNYQHWIQQLKQKVALQKPYTQVSDLLLDGLASTNANVCIYGFGSKIEYLRHIGKTYFSDHYVWQVNGYKIGLSEKKVYNNFGELLKLIKKSIKIEKMILIDQLKQFREHLDQMQKDKMKKIVVIFHCLDSNSFLNYESQLHLSELFSHPQIKLICSIDSIKVASIWHPTIKTNFNFRFFQVDTKVPNIDEQIHRPNTTDLKEQDDQGLMHIFQSLNNNQKRILKLFAKKQLENSNRDQPEYYTLQTLLQECIDNVILSSDTQLRENLYQLMDHKVLVLVNKQRVERQRVRKHYTIQCNKTMLQKIYYEKIKD